jgi:hypothetical protein
MLAQLYMALLIDEGRIDQGLYPGSLRRSGTSRLERKARRAGGGQKR